MNISYKTQTNIGYRFVIDALSPYSPYGEKLRRELAPRGAEDSCELIRQLDNVQRAADCLQSHRAEHGALSRKLMALKDVTASVERIEILACGDVELFELKRFLLTMQGLCSAFAALNAAAGFSGIALYPLPEALAILDPEGGGSPTFRISERLSVELANIRSQKRTLELKLRELSGREREEALIQRSIIVSAEEREEERLRRLICERLKPYVPQLRENLSALGELDLTLAKARLAAAYGAVRPVLGGETLRLDDMTNPMVQAALKERGRDFTPISIELTKGSTVITGANMGGKSIAIKTLQLNVCLALSGLFCFAKAAQIPLFSAMHAVAEDEEDTRNGLSSFGAEVVRLNDALSECRSGLSLLLFDELARGTNPTEGSMIVEGVIRFLNDKPVLALFATHFDGAASFAVKHYQVVGLRNMDPVLIRAAIKGGTQGGVDAIRGVMDYGLVPVSKEDDVPHDAMTICALLGMDRDLLHEIDPTAGHNIKEKEQ